MSILISQIDAIRIRIIQFEGASPLNSTSVVSVICGDRDLSRLCSVPDLSFPEHVSHRLPILIFSADPAVAQALNSSQVVRETED
jgi:hypothetical protein